MMKINLYRLKLFFDHNNFLKRASMRTTPPINPWHFLHPKIGKIFYQITPNDRTKLSLQNCDVHFPVICIEKKNFQCEMKK